MSRYAQRMSVRADAKAPASSAAPQRAPSPEVAPPHAVLQLQRALGNHAVGHLLHGATPASPASALPSALAASLGTRIGADLSDVRVHGGERSADAAGSLGARAFTVG